MSAWIKNLRMALDNKQVVILHGNVRDRYVDERGHLFDNLTSLLSDLCRANQVSFSEMLVCDPRGDERIIALRATPSEPPRTPVNELDSTRAKPRSPAVSDSRERVPVSRLLAGWERKLRDVTVNRFAVLFYLDKLIPCRESYGAEDRLDLFWLEKVIENIGSNHRLVLVALRDSMVPSELYHYSPRCRMVAVPLPDNEDRSRYLEQKLGQHEQKGLVAALSDGLFLHDLDGIVEGIRSLEHASATQVRKVVNLYRLGEQEDYWGRLDINRLNGAKRWFTQEEGVKGQDQAIDKICAVLNRARAGLSGMARGTATKPKGILFFAGPPGVGKTLLAKKLAKFLFGTEEAFIRIDMSELKDEHSMSKLIGAPPGYVGYERGGLLTDAVRERPFSVVLFDEIEKAHPKIMDVFLQLLDEGRLTDSKGQTVFFGETVVIFTSNIGNRAQDRGPLQRVLDDHTLSETECLASVQEHFSKSVSTFFESEISRPELLRRIGDNIVAFNHIRAESVQREILTSHLGRIKCEFEDRFRHLGHKLEVDTESVVALLLAKHGKDTMARFGGGGITNAIEDELIDALAPEVLGVEDAGRKEVVFRVEARGEEIHVEPTC